MSKKILLAVVLVCLAAYGIAKKLQKYDMEILKVVKTSMNEEPPAYFALTHFTDQFHGKKNHETRWIELTSTPLRLTLDSVLTSSGVSIISPIEKTDLNEVSQEDIAKILQQKNLLTVASY